MLLTRSSLSRKLPISELNWISTLIRDEHLAACGLLLDTLRTGPGAASSPSSDDIHRTEHHQRQCDERFGLRHWHGRRYYFAFHQRWRSYGFRPADDRCANGTWTVNGINATRLANGPISYTVFMHDQNGNESTTAQPATKSFLPSPWHQTFTTPTRATSPFRVQASIPATPSR